MEQALELRTDHFRDTKEKAKYSAALAFGHAQLSLLDSFRVTQLTLEGKALCEN